jgi:TolA-binding protein
MATEAKETTQTTEEKPAEIDVKALFPDPKAPTDKTDVKQADTSSSEEKVESPEDMKAQVEALTKELARVRKGKAESSSEVQELREQLAELRGRVEGSSKGSTDTQTEENRLAKYNDEQLIQGQTEWEDAAYDAREAMKRARTDNDEDAYAKAAKASTVAKNTLNAIRKELLERTKRVGAEQAQAQTEKQELVSEISGLYENAYQSFPELKDKESELWKAGNEVFNRHPKLMKSLGPLAELVATGIAITENPKLVPSNEGKGEKKARKELLEEINERAEQSLIKGRGTPNKKTVPDFEAMPKDQFDGLVHKLKMGG